MNLPLLICERMSCYVFLWCGSHFQAIHARFWLDSWMTNVNFQFYRDAVKKHLRTVLVQPVVSAVTLLPSLTEAQPANLLWKPRLGLYLVGVVEQRALAAGATHVWVSLLVFLLLCGCHWLDGVEEINTRFERASAHVTLSFRWNSRFETQFPPCSCCPGLGYWIVLHLEPTGLCHPNGEAGSSSRLYTAWGCQGWPLPNISLLGCCALSYRFSLISCCHQQQFLKKIWGWLPFHRL